MHLYGEELLKAGIILLVISLSAAALFTVYFLLSKARLKKCFEKEYGPKNN